MENKFKTDFPYKKELVVDNDIEIIEQLYTDHNIIQLRKINNETKLILGCGNYPISFEGFSFTRPVYQNHMDPKYAREMIKYGMQHKHDGCYTINPDIGMNPSIIGEFGIQDMKFLPGDYFEEIQFEGFVIDCDVVDGQIHTENKCTINNLIYLLKENGIVSTKREKEILRKCGDVL